MGLETLATQSLLDECQRWATQFLSIPGSAFLTGICHGKPKQQSAKALVLLTRRGRGPNFASECQEENLDDSAETRL
jgi:hypothetical protein